MIQQTDLRLLLVIHQQVYIAVRPLFAAGIGPKSQARTIGCVV